MCTLALSIATGCPTRTGLNSDDIAEIRARYAGQTFYLRQSVYVGDFYDDGDRRLVAARPFSELRLMTAPDGEIIEPPPARGIVRAGTKVRVVAVELPTSATILTRPLFTPRYNVWVRMRVGRFQGDVDFFLPEEHVAVLPTTVRTPAQIHAALDALLSTADLDTWLAGRSAEVRQAIAEKRALPGMTFEELTAALGLPDQVERRFEDNVRIDSASFGPRLIVLREDVVTDILDGGPQSAPRD